MKKVKTALKFKPLLMVLMLTVMLFGNTLTVFAATGGTSDTIKAYIAENGDNMSSSVSGKFKKVDDINEVTSGGTYGAEYRYYEYSTDAGSVYYVILQADEATVEGTISRMSQSQGVVNDLNTSVIDGYTLAADTAAANRLMTGFTEPIATLLGILVVLVTVGMTVFTAFDLSYIAFPVFREKCDEKKSTGGMGTKQGKDGNTKLTFITDDAQHAVIAADTVQSGKSPFVIYFKTRALSYILLAIVIFILLTGNINIFATLALKLVQGILDFLQGVQ